MHPVAGGIRTTIQGVSNGNDGFPTGSSAWEIAYESTYPQSRRSEKAFAPRHSRCGVRGSALFEGARRDRLGIPLVLPGGLSKRGVLGRTRAAFSRPLSSRVLRAHHRRADRNFARLLSDGFRKIEWVRPRTSLGGASSTADYRWAERERIGDGSLRIRWPGRCCRAVDVSDRDTLYWLVVGVVCD